MKKSFYEFCVENEKEDLLRQWDEAGNGALTPETVSYGNGKKVWWRCEKGHTWQAVISSRSGGKGCPVCSGRMVAAGVNDLASVYPALAAQWHPSKNGKLTPQEVTSASNKRVWWKCPRGHEWQTAVYSRTQDFTDCPYCTNRKVLAGFNDLATVQPRLAALWHPSLNGALTPKQVTAGSKKKVWWVCPEGHEWKAAVHARAGNRKNGCPVCAGNVSQKRRQKYQTSKIHSAETKSVC